MDNFTLESSMRTDITSVSNTFIDEYMPRANGDFVKVYLHLLRLINDIKPKITLSTIADKFNFTEGDVMRALRYWEGLGLLTISLSENNVIKGIRLEPFGHKQHYIIKGVQSMQLNPNITGNNTSNEVSHIPKKKHYSQADINSYSSDDTFESLKFIAEQYLKKPLNTTDINSILYMYDVLELTSTFIEYIMETTISNGYKTMRAVEKMAIELYSHDIKDVPAAKKYFKHNSALEKKVLKAFGITNRLPGKEESNYILKWQDEFGYSEDLIIEACNRTITHVHNPSFNYANSILAHWHEAGVKNIDDIAKLDTKHSDEQAKKAVTKKRNGVPKVNHKAGHNFSSHEYDFKALERELLSR